MTAMTTGLVGDDPGGGSVSSPPPLDAAAYNGPMPLKYGLVDPKDLPLPNLTPRLQGLRIAHVSDLHVRRERPRYDRLIHQLAHHRTDLVFYTGDYMSEPGDEEAAARVMRRLAGALRPTLGSFGVFGNHDTPKLVEMLADLPIRWLINDRVRLQERGIEVMGLHTQGRAYITDAVELLLRDADEPAPAWPAGRPLRLMLSHLPRTLSTAADLGVDVMFAGHTHGGQMRLPTGHALKNSSDLPLRMTSGLLRCRNSIAAVSRGLGEMTLPVRLFCPPHAPIYTLRRQSLPGRSCDTIECLWRW